MKKFRAAKPDPRILILQVIVSVALLSTFHTRYGVYALFAVLAIILLILCGWKAFWKNTVSFLALNGALFLLTTVPVPVISELFPPFFTMLVRVYPAWLTLKILTVRSQMDEMLFVLDRMHISKTISIPFNVCIEKTAAQTIFCRSAECGLSADCLHDCLFCAGASGAPVYSGAFWRLNFYHTAFKA